MANKDSITKVTRLVQNQFHSIPQDPDQKAAVEDVLTNGVNATLDHFEIVTGLAIRSFIMGGDDVVAEAWEANQKELWKAIQITFNDITMDTPGDWGVDNSISHISNGV